ncbi:unnamed protein product, partial [Nesidiocoris tenuis]
MEDFDEPAAVNSFYRVCPKSSMSKNKYIGKVLYQDEQRVDCKQKSKICEVVVPNTHTRSNYLPDNVINYGCLHRALANLEHPSLR